MFWGGLGCFHGPQNSRAVHDIANPIDPIDRSIRILNQVVAMERDEAAVYKTCNRTKPNRTYGNYRTYPAEPTEIIEHPDRTYGNYDLSISGINCITCQNDQNFEDQAPISLFTKDFM